MTLREFIKASPRKTIAGITVLGLAAVHVGFLAKGLRPPVAVDQGLIAALGALFAPSGQTVSQQNASESNPKEGSKNEKA
jgi:hypothetical protein